MSEGDGSSAAAGADAGFSPAQLAAIAGVVEEVLNRTRTDRAESTATGSCARKGDAVDPGVRCTGSHLSGAGTSGDSSESASSEEKNKHVMHVGVSGDCGVHGPVRPKHGRPSGGA